MNELDFKKLTPLVDPLFECMVEDYKAQGMSDRMVQDLTADIFAKDLFRKGIIAGLTIKDRREDRKSALLYVLFLLVSIDLSWSLYLLWRNL